MKKINHWWATQAADERFVCLPWKRLLHRPEFGRISGAALVLVFFFITRADSGMFASDGKS